mmetsp:Transcript_17137/g.48271  ORF Transcript_17137/g.48271 Transcript_17137/m.48271 type:complete len:90 (-) Transcript_17137:1909-2178(-)
MREYQEKTIPNSSSPVGGDLWGSFDILVKHSNPNPHATSRQQHLSRCEFDGFWCGCVCHSTITPSEEKNRPEEEEEEVMMYDISEWLCI